MYPFFHNYKMALEVVTSVQLVKKKKKTFRQKLACLIWYTLACKDTLMK